MALNFPTDTSAPYYDSVSGLKYIYNSSIGAWETAIQPPAVVYPTPPTIDIPGFLWWDETEGRLKIWYVSGGTGVWVDATPTPPPVTVNTSEFPPAEPVAPVPDNGARGNSYISQGDTPPADPDPNDMWFDTASGNLFIYYEDADSSQWVITQNISSNTPQVEEILVSGALAVAGTTTRPSLSIASASTTVTGTTRLATTAESTAGAATNVALTPGVLKSTISSYVSGTVDYATTAETTAGTHTTKAVTPAGLAAALPSLGTANPTGTIITFANQTPPSTYLKCDGSAVSRTTYSALFAVIGTIFGAGDTVSTFNLPTLTNDNAMIIHCIKQ